MRILNWEFWGGARVTDSTHPMGTQAVSEVLLGCGMLCTSQDKAGYTWGTYSVLQLLTPELSPLLHKGSPGELCRTWATPLRAPGFVVSTGIFESPSQEIPMYAQVGNRQPSWRKKMNSCRSSRNKCHRLGWLLAWGQGTHPFWRRAANSTGGLI